MLKKIVFAAALVVGFVTSFSSASTSPVRPALECTKVAVACTPDFECPQRQGCPYCG
jgi:hypothetical protein